MNARSLFHTAAPFLFLAVLFAILMHQAQYGFLQMTEDTTAFMLQQLASGTFPRDAELGASLSSAPLFMPFYLLWLTVAGSADGSVYFARLVVTGLSFAAALAIFQVGSRDGYRNLSLMIAVSVLLLPSVRFMGLALGLALVLLSLAGLCAWCARAQYLADDGTQTGYVRVLLPFCAGMLVLFASLCSWITLLIASLVASRGVISVRSRGESLIPFVWALAGVAVGLIVICIYLLGFEDPGMVLSAYFRSPFQDVIPFISADTRVAGLCAACYLAALALMVGTTLTYDAGKLTVVNALLFAVGILVACVIAQVFWLASVRADCAVALQDGPAAYLIASENEAASYKDAQLIAKIVGDDEVQVQSSNKWMSLLFENAVTTEDSQVFWTFVACDTADELEDDVGAQSAYAVIVQNSAGTLYRSASKQSYISQG